MLNILITGAQGFIGQNVLAALGRDPKLNIESIDIGDSRKHLETGLQKCDALIHLAGINRALSDADYEFGNVGVLDPMLTMLEGRQQQPLIILSSSIQAGLDNPYGRSKRHAEEILDGYCRRTGASARIFRLPGVFGKWCRPNYNSVVATFCHNIVREIPIQISDPQKEIDLVHVDDVVLAFRTLIDEEVRGFEYRDVAPAFKVKLGELAGYIRDFHEGRNSLKIADLSDPFLRRLYGTYMSYLPPDGFAYPLQRKLDPRGELAEILKADGHGQLFISRTKPGIVRGNHYHDLKVEKFLVLEGEAKIGFRNISTSEKAEYRVEGRDMKVVDIPPGWTHSLENVGKAEMIVLFWASEVFDEARPDTYPAEV